MNVINEFLGEYALTGAFFWVARFIVLVTLDPDNDEKTLEKVSRYEAHLSRLIFKALHELEAIQTRRSGAPLPWHAWTWMDWGQLNASLRSLLARTIILGRTSALVAIFGSSPCWAKIPLVG